MTPDLYYWPPPPQADLNNYKVHTYFLLAALLCVHLGFFVVMLISLDSQKDFVTEVGGGDEGGGGGLCLWVFGWEQ